MSRRWVAEIEPKLYLRRTSTLAGLPGHHADEPELEPVTISYATLFKTKREVVALLEERGLTALRIMRTWW